MTKHIPSPDVRPRPSGGKPLARAAGEGWRSRGEGLPSHQRPYGFYVHLPFCRMLCVYCDFVKYKGMEGWFDRYGEAVIREAGAWREQAPGRPAASLYCGGGTPSAVGVARLARLRQELGACYGLEAEAEVGLEANPEDVDAAFAAGVAAAGFNRVSVGMQTFDDGLLRRLGRLHTGAQAAEAARRLLATGALSVSGDLMFGLPGQTMDAWRADLEQAIALGLHHLSCYALTLESATPLGRRVQAGRVTVPTDDAAADMYALACARLAAAGYQHYEVSNWALPGHASRHNRLYWSGDDYVGLGAGAVGCLDGRRWWNVRAVAAYCERIEATGSAVATEERLTPAERAHELVLLALRTAEGLDLVNFRRDTGVDLAQQTGAFWRDAQEHGLLTVVDGHLRVPEGRWGVLHSITARLLAEVQET